MVLADLLNVIGVEGALVTIAAVAFGMYHFRSGIQVASQAATWMYAMMVALAFVVIASTGIIPGIDLNPIVQVQTFLDWLGGVLGGLWGAFTGLLGAMLPVSCVRCAVAAAHPRAALPATCPNCGRRREGSGR